MLAVGTNLKARKKGDNAPQFTEPLENPLCVWLPPFQWTGHQWSSAGAANFAVLRGAAAGAS